MAYTNTEKSEAISESLWSQFTPLFGMDNPWMFTVLESTVYKHWHTKHVSPEHPFGGSGVHLRLKKGQIFWGGLYFYEYAYSPTPKFYSLLLLLLTAWWFWIFFSTTGKELSSSLCPKVGWRIFMLLLVFSLFLYYALKNFWICPCEPLKDVPWFSWLILEQFGFQACHSMQHQLWRVTELFHDGIRSSGVAGVIFLDVQKLFAKSGTSLFFSN